MLYVVTFIIYMICNVMLVVCYIRRDGFIDTFEHATNITIHIYELYTIHIYANA